jgi:hypothetical protein
VETVSNNCGGRVSLTYWPNEPPIRNQSNDRYLTAELHRCTWQKLLHAPDGFFTIIQ